MRAVAARLAIQWMFGTFDRPSRARVRPRPLNWNQQLRVSIAALAPRAAFVGLALLPCLEATVSTQAGVTFTFDATTGQLNVIGTAGNDSVSVNVTGGNVTVTSFATQTNTGVAAGNVKALLLDLRGGGDVGTSSLSTVNAPALASVTIDGGAGQDFLTGAGGPELFLGGDGDDNLSGGTGAGSGSDTFVGGPGFDTVTSALPTAIPSPSSSLTDVLHVVLDGATERKRDVLTTVEAVAITGTPGADTINATSFTGAFSVQSQAGNDVITAPQAVPRAEVQALVPTRFHDISTSSGDDRVTGGPWHERMTDALGSDTVNAGLGTDTLSLGNVNNATATDTTVVRTAPGLTGTFTTSFSGIDVVQLSGSNGNDTMDASAVTAFPVILLGFNGNDTLRGGSKNDTVTGGGGNDSLHGGGGTENTIAETIFGGSAVISDTTIVYNDAVLPNQRHLPAEIDGHDEFEIVRFDNLGTSAVIDAAAFSGKLRASGESGNDTLIASKGPSVLSGYLGDNTYIGNNTDTTIFERVSSSSTSTDPISIVLGASTNKSPGSNSTHSGVTGQFWIVPHAAGVNLDASLFLGNITIVTGDGPDDLQGGKRRNYFIPNGGNDRVRVIGNIGEFHRQTFQPVMDTQAFATCPDQPLGPAPSPVAMAERMMAAFDGDAPIPREGCPVNPASDVGVTFVVNDTLSTGAGTDTLEGINEVILLGTPNDDLLDASQFTAGPVTLDGGAGNDTLLGGRGPDSILGGLGDDLLVGGAGDDTLAGGPGNDILRAGRGNDVLIVRRTEGVDTIDAGTGVDRLDYAAEGRPFARDATGITVDGAKVVQFTDPPESLVADGTPQPRTYLLSEGASGAFFDLDIAVANPNATAVPVTAQFLKEDGSTVTNQFSLPALSRRTLKVDQLAGLENSAMSTLVTADNGLPLLVERSMFWDAGYYGGHTGSAVENPRTRWLFGEGAQGFFDTFVLLANANAAPANVTVRFLREDGQVVTHNVTVNATSRRNVFAGDIPELANQSFSIVVDSSLPITAERAMYFGRPPAAPLFAGGHESAGVSDPDTEWFLPEGATGPFFDTFVLIGNPNNAVANVTVRYLLPSGQVITKQKTVAANSRLTIYVDSDDAALADTAVSTQVTSDVGVVVERAMYWPGGFSTWHEAHNAFGLTETGLRWGLAEGRVGQSQNFETFILLANPNATAAQVRISYLRASGAPVVKTYAVAANSRFNVWANADVPELSNEEFGALIEVTNGVPIAVERALYFGPAGGPVWPGGTNATAIRLP